jgi:hypothetical protein
MRIEATIRGRPGFRGQERSGAMQRAVVTANADFSDYVLSGRLITHYIESSNTELLTDTEVTVVLI